MVGSAIIHQIEHIEIRVNDEVLSVDVHDGVCKLMALVVHMGNQNFETQEKFAI